MNDQSKEIEELAARYGCTHGDALRTIASVLDGIDPHGAQGVRRIANDVDEFIAENARMRAITGPPCPKCGHFLKAEHSRIVSGRDRFVRGAMETLCVTASELLSDHPEIAAEMGIA